MASTRQAQAEQTRARILSAARELFGSRGYHATGTNEIVAAAGVGTRGALYHHFPDKKQLFVAVLDELTAEFVADSEAKLSGCTGVDAVQTAMETFFDHSLDAGVRRIILDGPVVVGWEGWRDLHLREGLRVLRGLIDAGVAEGSMVVADPESLAHLLLAVSDAAAQFIAHADHPERARVQSGDSLRDLLSGLAAGARPAAPRTQNGGRPHAVDPHPALRTD